MTSTLYYGGELLTLQAVREAYYCTLRGARASRSHNQETHTRRFITPLGARKCGSTNRKVKSAFQPHYSREPAAWEDEWYNQNAAVLNKPAFGFVSLEVHLDCMTPL